MKILLDTCIVIDFLQKREPFAQAAYDIFYAIATNKLSCFITAKSATDIYYLMYRFTHNEQLARNNLSSLLTVVAVLDTKADDIFEAIVSPTSDFEDADDCHSKEQCHQLYSNSKHQGLFQISSTNLYS